MKIIILSGPYCSGKTTWALKYCSKHKKSIRINKKELIKTISCNEIRVDIVNITKSLYDHLIEEAIRNDLDIIIDDEHLLKSTISSTISNISRICEQLRKEGLKIDIDVKVKVFDKTPFIICQRRNLKSPNPKSIKLITKSYIQIHKSI